MLRRKAWITEGAHRPYPMPDAPYIMHQIWEDLLFLHYRVDPARLRQLVPPQLELDLWTPPGSAGSPAEAYVAVVPFRMRGIRPRFLPAVPWLSAFAELNVRTYVRVGDRPGVYFFSLDAANPVGVFLGRRGFHLPYQNARMRCDAIANPDMPADARPDFEDGADARWLDYESVRTHRGSPAAEFRGRYGPTAPVELTLPGTLVHWLTERYCLYSIDPRGRVHRGEIHHRPWPLQSAGAAVTTDTMCGSHGIALESSAVDSPLLHFARSMEVIVWPTQIVG